MWVLIVDGNCWYFSTEELARDAVEFFDLDEDDYDLDFDEVKLDDEYIINKFRKRGFKPEKYRRKED